MSTRWILLQGPQSQHMPCFACWAFSGFVRALTGALCVRCGVADGPGLCWLVLVFVALPVCCFQGRPEQAGSEEGGLARPALCLTPARPLTQPTDRSPDRRPSPRAGVLLFCKHTRPSVSLSLPLSLPLSVIYLSPPFLSFPFHLLLAFRSLLSAFQSDFHTQTLFHILCQ